MDSEAGRKYQYGSLRLVDKNEQVSQGSSALYNKEKHSARTRSLCAIPDWRVLGQKHLPVSNMPDMEVIRNRSLAKGSLRTINEGQALCGVIGTVIVRSHPPRQERLFCSAVLDGEADAKLF